VPAGDAQASLLRTTATGEAGSLDQHFRTAKPDRSTSAAERKKPQPPRSRVPGGCSMNIKPHSDLPLQAISEIYLSVANASL